MHLYLCTSLLDLPCWSGHTSAPTECYKEVREDTASPAIEGLCPLEHVGEGTP